MPLARLKVEIPDEVLVGLAGVAVSRSETRDKGAFSRLGVVAGVELALVDALTGRGESVRSKTAFVITLHRN